MQTQYMVQVQMSADGSYRVARTIDGECVEWQDVECKAFGTGKVYELQGDAYSSGEEVLQEGCKLYEDAKGTLYTAYEQV